MGRRPVSTAGGRLVGARSSYDPTLVSARPRVDVVILTWNDGSVVEDAVESVLRSMRVAPEVIVVDNGSEPAAHVPTRDHVRVIRNSTNRGIAPARNQGAILGDAPFICFLDSDAVVEPDAIAELVEAVTGELVALAAPVFVGQRPTASAGRAPGVLTKSRRALNLSNEYEATTNDFSGVWEVDFAIGACQLVRREAFEAVNGLDERYFYGPEDVDFCLRLKDAGWRVVQVAGARVHHPPRRRHRRLVTARGLRHGGAIARHLWKHRTFRRRHR